MRYTILCLNSKYIIAIIKKAWEQPTSRLKHFQQAMKVLRRLSGSYIFDEWYMPCISFRKIVKECHAQNIVSLHSVFEGSNSRVHPELNPISQKREKSSIFNKNIKDSLCIPISSQLECESSWIFTIQNFQNSADSETQSPEEDEEHWTLALPRRRGRAVAQGGLCTTPTPTFIFFCFVVFFCNQPPPPG